MPWARLNDGSNDDAKLNELTSDAFRLWIRALVYCQKNLTDGRISEQQVRALSGWLKDKERTGSICELCASLVPGKGPLWHKVEGGYQIHDYLDWNDSREKVLAARDKAEKRLNRFQNRKRFRNVANAIRDAVHNGVDDALENAFRIAPDTAVHNGVSTYHVPEEPEKQEHAPNGANASITDVRVRMLRRERSKETIDGKPAVRVITALARHLIIANPDFDEGELMDAVKRNCAGRLTYDSIAAAKAIDTARAQLARQFAKLHGERQEAAR